MYRDLHGPFVPMPGGSGGGPQAFRRHQTLRRVGGGMDGSYIEPGCNSLTAFYEGDAGSLIQVYPCRCGRTHRGRTTHGEYAYEDWMHHTCYHRSHLAQIHRNQAICMECGQSFLLEDASVPENPNKP